MSLLSEETYQNFFSDISLQQSTVKPKSYTGEGIPVLGQMNVVVQYNQQEENLCLLVVKALVAAYLEEIGPLIFHEIGVKFIKFATGP